MAKTTYRGKRGLGIAFYLSGAIVFLILSIAYIAWASLTDSALERNEGILTSVASAVGLTICAIGLYYAYGSRLPHAFFLSGFILTLLSLRGLFDNAMPVMMDGGESLGLTGWGVAAVIAFSVLSAIGIIASALPKKYLFVRKFLIIIGMTVLIAIDGVTFVSEAIEMAGKGLGAGTAAWLSVLSALTNLVPIATLGMGIAFLLDINQEIA